MRRAIKKQEMLARRHRRVRGRVQGTAARPRLAVHRSHKQIYVQVIDAIRGVTLAASSSLQLSKGGELGEAKGGNISGATVVGTDIAKKAKAAGIEAVCFDRGGYRYHGRIKALADAARTAGLEF